MYGFTGKYIYIYIYIYIYNNIYIIIYTVLIICNCVFQVYNVYMTSFGMALGHTGRKWPFSSSVLLCHPKYYLITRPIKLVITIQCKILAGKVLWRIWQNKHHSPIFYPAKFQIFSSPKLLNYWFAAVLPHQNFALYVIQHL